MHLRRLAPYALLAAVALLAGCTLSRAQIRRADAVVAATTAGASSCDRPDHCAHPSPLLEAAAQALAESTPA
ncbi:MAG: phospholipase, partial [Frateuria sp.]|nr:phospholipase [Frateuria sp.]